MSANSLKKCKTFLGDYARKMKSRLGKKAGNVASAHKLARTVYTMLKDKCPYNPMLENYPKKNGKKGGSLIWRNR
jgi:hypothetical protein